MATLTNGEEVSTTAKCTFKLPENGTYYDSDGEGNDIDDSEESEEPSNWDHQVVDPKTGKWIGKRGSNNNPTKGVRGTGPKTVKK